jgi:hypothetical protein
MKYIGYLVHRTSTTGEQVLKYCVNTLLCEPNKKTRAQQSKTNKNNVTMTTIKHCIRPRRTAPLLPWSGRYGSNSFWLLSCSLKKNFDFATNTARNICFIGSTGFLLFWYLFTCSHVALYWDQHGNKLIESLILYCRCYTYPFCCTWNNSHSISATTTVPSNSSTSSFGTSPKIMFLYIFSTFWFYTKGLISCNEYHGNLKSSTFDMQWVSWKSKIFYTQSLHL